MFYVYSIFLPILIVSLIYRVGSFKVKTYRELVSFVSIVLPYLMSYTFLLYFLNMEGYIDTGWSFYALIFFLIPILFVIMISKVFFLTKLK